MGVGAGMRGSESTGHLLEHGMDGVVTAQEGDFVYQGWGMEKREGVSVQKLKRRRA